MSSSPTIKQSEGDVQVILVALVLSANDYERGMAHSERVSRAPGSPSRDYRTASRFP